MLNYTLLYFLIILIALIWNIIKFESLVQNFNSLCWLPHNEIPHNGNVDVEDYAM